MSENYIDKKECIETLIALGVKPKKDKTFKDDYKIEELKDLIKEANNKRESRSKPIPKAEDVDKIKITPKKDWLLHCPPHTVKQELKKDVETYVFKMFESTLKTENVI